MRLRPLAIFLTLAIMVAPVGIASAQLVQGNTEMNTEMQAEAAAQAQAQTEGMAQAMASIQAVLDGEAELSVQAQESLMAVMATLEAHMEAGATAETASEAEAAAQARAKALVTATAQLRNLAAAPDTPDQAAAVLAEVASELAVMAAVDLGFGTHADLRLGLGLLTDIYGEGRVNALLAVATRLEDVMAEMEARGDLDTAAKIEATIDRLVLMVESESGAITRAEALADVEAAIEARAMAGVAAPEELDIQAQVQIAQGKRSEAHATVMERLALQPRTEHAYDVLLNLEQELGMRADLDTWVNGRKVAWDERPFIEDGRTLVPVRKLAERLGAEVTWDGETRTVTVVQGDTTIDLVIDSHVAIINGVQVNLDVPARIVGIGRTVLPIRFVSESLNLEVHWQAEHRAIVVYGD